ncbi:uncharacterized protein LOC131938070 [Physella acuta]|uniref:uncharacterized protein LOC131938070 n=1 Tax=Physella acuta TaxID=109671 RepID=UPI0027DCE4CD|nr:uncharacterized protein LOC131938070 [Physella acuta]
MVAEGITHTVATVWPDVPMNKDDVCYLIGALPHATFVRVSWLITSFITFERCLCVSMPLNVKQIITGTRTVVAMVCIYVIVFLGMSPFFIGNQLSSQFNPQTNTSRIVRVSIADVFFTDNIGHNFSVAAQFGSIIISLVSTAVIVRQMEVKWKWRIESTSGAQSEKLSVRDKKLVKMVLTILYVYIACLIPSCLTFILEIVYQERFSFMGPNYNVYLCVVSVIITFEVAHSTVNILIYYYMKTSIYINKDSHLSY